jgi:hypothetical protein
MKTNVTTGIIILMLNGEVIDAVILRPISKNGSNVFERFTKILREKGVLSDTQSICSEVELRDNKDFKFSKLSEKGISISTVEIDDTKRNCNSLVDEINYLSGIASSSRDAIKEENRPTLISEILNLWNGVGEGYVEGDSYAPNRYYSKIPGVKNIRLNGNDDKILVKVRSQRGYLIPDTVNINGGEVSITFYESEKYSDEMDY